MFRFGIAAAILLALLLLHFRLIGDARTNAIRERDLYWQSEIQKSNATAVAKANTQHSVALASDVIAQTEIANLTTRLKQLEKENAALSDDNRCALDRGRVRLLNKVATGG